MLSVIGVKIKFSIVILRFCKKHFFVANKQDLLYKQACQQIPFLKGYKMNKKKTFDKVQKAMSEGCLWRAKEILQGTIGSSCGYDIDIYERYGQVLLQMGDQIEAGKYLFLCGQREPEYEQPIELYLKRFSKDNLQILYSTFPKAARLEHIKDYPEQVQKYIIDRGYTNKALKNYCHKRNLELKQTFFSKVCSRIFGFILMLILIAFIIGVLSIIAHGFSLFGQGFRSILDWFTRYILIK